MWLAAQQWGQPGQGLLLVLGPGDTAVRLAFAGELTLTVALLALAAKMLATLTTITSGGSAGLLFPSLYFGAMVAVLFAELFGYEPMMIIIPAMTASLVAIANTPLAAILFVVEVFGSAYMVPGLLTLVVAFILSHESTIYRTQRDAAASRPIMPGVSVRRVRIPAAWHGRSLIDLGLRQQFGVTVIGALEQSDRYGHPLVRLGESPTRPLRRDDVLVILGADEQLEELMSAVRAIEAADEAEM
jgi:CIC family chloride channel protein